MRDPIERQDAIDAVKCGALSAAMVYGRTDAGSTALSETVKAIKALPSAWPEQRWIPFTTRPLTEEEKEGHSEWDSILDCKLPDDGQRILVSVSVRGHECVQQDEFYTDDGCYLDSGYEIGTEAVAWMQLPEPYAERRKNE